MNIKYLQFQKEADLRIIESNDKAKVITAAIALAISNTLSLPTSELEDPTHHFNLQVQGAVKPIVSTWNENVVMDAKECVEMVRAFWTIRYYAAHPSSRPIFSDNVSFWDSLFSVKTFISPTINVMLNANVGSIIDLSRSAAVVMANKE